MGARRQMGTSCQVQFYQGSQDRQWYWSIHCTSKYPVPQLLEVARELVAQRYSPKSHPQPGDLSVSTLSNEL